MIPVAPSARSRDSRSTRHSGLVCLLGLVLTVAALVFGFMAARPFDYTSSRPTLGVALGVGGAAAAVNFLCVLAITHLGAPRRAGRLEGGRKLRTAALWTLGVLVTGAALVGIASFLVGHQVKANEKGVHAWGSDVEWSRTHFAVGEPRFSHPAQVPAELDFDKGPLDEQPLSRPLPAGMKLARVEWSFRNEGGRNGGGFWLSDVIGPYLSVRGGEEEEALPENTADCTSSVSGSRSWRPKGGATGRSAACWLVPEDVTADDLVVRLGPGPNDVEWARWGQAHD